MRKREREEVYALTGVTGKVEQLTARRQPGLNVGQLRVLVRIAGLTEKGALITSANLQQAALSSSRAVRRLVKELQEGEWIVKEGGGKIAGHLVLTSKAQHVCQEHAGALERAATSFLAFEPVKPYQRLKPRKQ